MLYNGANNGRLFLSIRTAALLLNAGKSSVADWFADLEDRGFIRAVVRGAFDYKAGAKSGQATTWALTEFEHDGQLASRDYRKWVPGPHSKRVPENISRSALKDGSYPTPDSLYPTPDTMPKSVRPQGHLRGDSAHSEGHAVPESGHI